MFDSHVHASDRARMIRAASDSPEPGTLEEAEALLRIDEARADFEDEISGRSARRRRRALARHWSDYGAQVS